MNVEQVLRSLRATRMREALSKKPGQPRLNRGQCDLCQRRVRIEKAEGR